MSVTVTTSSVSYVGSIDQSTTTFSVNYPFFHFDDLTVIERTIATGVTVTLVRGVDYDVSGTVDTTGKYSSGTVTSTKYAPLGPPSTVTWIIERDTSQTQSTVYVEGDAFPAKSHEAGLDRNILLNQEALREVDRSLRTPDGESDDMTLASVATRKSTRLGFDASGLPAYITSDVTGVAASAFGASLATAADASAARTLLGVPDFQVGTLAARPAASGSGLLYFVTDTYTWAYDDGAWQTASITTEPNLLDNASFDIWQRNDNLTPGTTDFPLSDAAFCADRWRFLTDGTNHFGVSKLADFLAPQDKWSLRFDLNAPGTPSRKWGILQTIENSNSPIEGVSVSCALHARCNVVGRKIRVGVLGWTGTADSPTSDPVSNWNPGSGTPTEAEIPTFAANWALIGSQQFTMTTTMEEYALTPIAIPASTYSNIAIFIWADSVDWLGTDLLHVGRVRMHRGTELPTYQRRPIAEEMARCGRFLNIFTGDDGVTSSLRFLWDANGAGEVMDFLIPLPIPMRIASGAPVVQEIGTWTPTNLTSSAYRVPGIASGGTNAPATHILAVMTGTAAGAVNNEAVADCYLEVSSEI